MLSTQARSFNPSHDTMLLTHPHVAAPNGFILLDERLPVYEVPDEELFDLPLSCSEAAEIEDMETINVLLASLEEKEQVQNLKFRLQLKQQEKQCTQKFHSVLSNLLKSTLKPQAHSPRAMSKRISGSKPKVLQLPCK